LARTRVTGGPAALVRAARRWSSSRVSRRGLVEVGIGVDLQAQATQVEEEAEAGDFVTFHQQHPMPAQRWR